MSIGMNQTKLDSFNKQTNLGKGTLMQNWHEEAQLREDTGIGRSTVPQHLKKKHTDLFLKTTDEVPLYKEVLKNPVDTTTRIFGKCVPDVPKPASKYVGGTFNPADSIPKVGKKQQLIEQQYLQQIESELQNQQHEAFNQTQQRMFDTTHQTNFNQKPQENNCIGRRVMRTQDGSAINANLRDVDLLSDMGFLQKPQLSSDQQLKSMLPQESYLTAKPITFHSEKQGHGTIYQSGVVNQERPFHKTDDFVKTFHHFTHIKN